MPACSLVEMVAVDAVGAGLSAFRGVAVPGPYGRIFGGQLIGQAAAAATAAVAAAAPGRTAHSMHATFLSAGDHHQPIDYDVSVLRDGRTFSVRSVRARQGERMLLSATVSFQVPAEGPGHETPSVAGYPDPDRLSPEHGDFSVGRLGAVANHRAAADIRRIPAELDPRDPVTRTGQAVWLRAAGGPHPASPGTNRAVLALATDFTLLESVVQRHDLTFATPGLSVASLDHSVWWHAAASLDDWVLYVQESPWSGGERGLATGSVYAQDGRLLATVAQEGLMRIAPGGQPTQ